MACPTNQSAISCTSFPTASDARNSISCLDVVFSEIASLQQLILQAINDCKSEILVSSGTPLTTVTSITGVNITAGGTGYFPVFATAEIVHPLGTGAQIDPIITNGRITSFAMTASGSGYAPILATASPVGGTTPASMQVIVGLDGKITNVNPVISGSGYATDDLITISHPSGQGAVVKVQTVNGTGGILSTRIENAGNGYQPVVAKVVVSHPVGMGFAGTVHVSSGAVIGVAVTSTGFGYETLNPTLEISSLNGANSTFTFSVNSTGTIQSITPINGGIGYLASDIATVVTALGTSGTGATATLQVSQGSIVDSMHYYKVWSGALTDAMATKHLNQIMDYFKCLGYVIQLRNNPQTQKSLSWYIKW